MNIWLVQLLGAYNSINLLYSLSSHVSSLPEGEMMEGESLEVLLSFALAHGNVNNIIDLIMILFEHLSMEIAVIPLLRKMESILQQKNLKHGE